MKSKKQSIQKNHAEIILTGNFNIKNNLPFEVYRQAVEHHVSGYIKFLDHAKSEIVVEAESKDVETFIHWLIPFVKEAGVNMNLNWADSLVNYKEFRIIH